MALYPTYVQTALAELCTNQAAPVYLSVHFMQVALAVSSLLEACGAPSFFMAGTVLARPSFPKPAVVLGRPRAVSCLLNSAALPRNYTGAELSFSPGVLLRSMKTKRNAARFLGGSPVALLGPAPVRGTLLSAQIFSGSLPVMSI